ncbi:putative isoamyl alcohol oxidase [Aspergillus stella-maris]|uniref:putative isoamyl alcohol oxidase n=1 Tax=Aspergillus stella-maris TaxID=1810926 RepID=UPI003CCCB9CC
MRLTLSASFLIAAVVPALAARNCKSTPQDATWPTIVDWTALNKSIDGTLIKTSPAASSCYASNPFGSTTNCTDVTNHWSYAAYHASWPESIDYSIFTNHSCLPPGVDGYTKERGCHIGALPAYIVNATNEEQIATAIKWADERNIRVVVKGTGHDMNGRSTGANAISIWTHNLRHFTHNPIWRIPGTDGTADVAILGSGRNWGSAYTAVHKVNRTLVGGEDASVGLGGLISNGGHGLLSSTYGLASDSVYQVTLVTPNGTVLVANDVQNSDIFWAIRGAGGGQFGVITEFVIATHPMPKNVVAGGLTIYATTTSGANASWDALVEIASLVPDIMDNGLTGQMMALTGSEASLLGLSNVSGVATSISLTGFNMTTAAMNTTINYLTSKIRAATHGRVTIIPTAPSLNTYWASTKPDPMASQSSGASSLISSRLLGRRELSDLPHAERLAYLQRILTPATAGEGSMALFGLQGGPGTAGTPEIRQGSTHPSWRRAYAHFMTYGAPVNSTADASTALDTGIQWYEDNTEPIWREWAPDMGSYANEGNVFSTSWKKDFYGENYERLMGVKQRYDPNGSLFTWGGVGSDEWEYNLHDGSLCQRN